MEVENRPFISDWAHVSQRGFISGRSILQNVIDIETAALAASYDADRRPVILLFDFAAAFPSLPREYLWTCLRALGVPASSISALRNLYADNQHFFKFGGLLHTAFNVTSGVRQGCPASASLFVLAIDPLLRAINSILPGGAQLCAFAEDLALVLPCISLAPAVSAIFETFSLFSGLQLRYDKCACVPLWTSNVQLSKDTLAALVPRWASMSHTHCATYLGYTLGPEGPLHRFDKAIRKFRDRCLMIRSTGVSLASRIILYNALAVPVFSYLAQLTHFTSQVATAEAQGLTSILRLPGNAIPPRLFGALSRLMKLYRAPTSMSSFFFTASRSRIVLVAPTSLGIATSRISSASSSKTALLAPRFVN